MRPNAKKPHVAHVLPWTDLGGTEVATSRIACAVRAYGYRSTVFTPVGCSAPVRHLFESGGIPIVEYTVSELSYRSPLPFIRSVTRLAWEFRRRKVDLVHCADMLAAVRTSYAARLAGVPVLCHVRNRHDSLTTRDARMLRPVSRYAFVSDHTWRAFGVEVEPDRGKVVHDGLRIPDLQHAEADRAEIRAELGLGDAPVITMVARIAPQKDYDTLVRAAAKVVRTVPDARFLLVGDYESAEVYRETHRRTRQLIEQEGLDSTFVFAGYRGDVPRVLNASDIFALSTHFEGLPLVLLEAMAHEMPVVATAVDGIPEAIEDGVTGYLVEHESVDQLADRLLALLTDGRRRGTMGRAGRASVVADFSEQAFARRMAGLYSEMLDIELVREPGRSRSNGSLEVGQVVNR